MGALAPGCAAPCNSFSGRHLWPRRGPAVAVACSMLHKSLVLIRCNEEMMMNYTPLLRMLLGVALSTGVVVVVTGCAQQATSFETGIHTEQTALRVRNDNWLDVRVYLVSESGAAAVRVGTVSAASSSVIRLRGRVLQEIRTRGSVRFLLRPIGSRASYTTPAMLVSPGDQIQLSVANQLVFSTFLVTRPY